MIEVGKVKNYFTILCYHARNMYNEVKFIGSENYFSPHLSFWILSTVVYQDS